MLFNSMTRHTWTATLQGEADVDDRDGSQLEREPAVTFNAAGGRRVNVSLIRWTIKKFAVSHAGARCPQVLRGN